MLSKLVLFGLGNPGKRYELTRHNLGFRVLDALCSDYGLEWVKETRSYVHTEFEIDTTRVVMAKPQTYVNLSGKAVADLGESLPFDPHELLVLADDIALPFRQLRLRKRGSDGGHNGLRSIITELGTTDFPRLRMGVGPVPPDVDPADYVLSPFSGDELDAVPRLVERAVGCVETVVRSGFDEAMGIFNRALPDPETG
ncbi:MAG: aminoacyl-tRNA hydrolase [Candidatus Latescibacterota bacterium]|nr:MAG: aminoacyl-tRNA hydrolase [Candidatus Latescibacterota bacterium]